MVKKYFLESIKMPTHAIGRRTTGDNIAHMFVLATAWVPQSRSVVVIPPLLLLCCWWWLLYVRNIAVLYIRYQDNQLNTQTQTIRNHGSRLYVRQFLLGFLLKIPGRFAGHEPTRGSRHGVFKMSRVGPGRVRSVPKSHGSGRVKTFFNLAGLVGSKSCQISWVGLGRDKR